jgi:hypothetical protein
MDRGDFFHELILFLHILSAIVGFGSTFVYPALSSRARKLAPDQGYAITHTAHDISKGLSRPFIYLTGITGIVLVFIYGNTIDDMGEAFGDAWVSIAFVLFIAGICVSEFLHSPNLKAMDAIQEKLVSGQAAAPAAGGPPPEVAELEARGKKAGMFGGLLHLIFLLILIDMIWKPGSPVGF